MIIFKFLFKFLKIGFKVLFCLILCFIIFLCIFIPYNNYKVDNDPFNKTQAFCQKWEEEQIKSGKDIVFVIQQGKAKITLPNKDYKTGYYDLQDGVCMPNSINLDFSLESLGIEKKGKIHDNAAGGGQVILFELQQPQWVILDEAKKESEGFSDDELYQVKFKMEHYPLWLYPKIGERFDKSIHQSSYVYGVDGYNDPVSNRPFLIGCFFEHPNPNVWSMTDEQLIYQELTKAKELVIGRPYPCRGSFYITTPTIGLEALVWLEDGAIPYADEIFPKLETHLKQILSER